MSYKKKKTERKFNEIRKMIHEQMRSLTKSWKSLKKKKEKIQKFYRGRR